MLKHSTFTLLSVALFWQSMDWTERIVAIALCVVVLALVVTLIIMLISSGKRKGEKELPTVAVPPQQPAPAPVPSAPAPMPIEGAYEKTALIHGPSVSTDEYEKTVAVLYRPSIETTFQIKSIAGVTERALPVSGDFIIGRNAEADLQLKDASVSQRHAQLNAADGMLHAQDLGSTNGVYLNGQKLEGAQPLRSGDTLRIGTIDIRVLYTPT